MVSRLVYRLICHCVVSACLCAIRVMAHSQHMLTDGKKLRDPKNPVLLYLNIVLMKHAD